MVSLFNGTLVFANGPGDLGSIPGRVIPKTLKMVLDTSLLNTQQYKVRIEGKVEQSRERSSTPLHLGVVTIEKGASWSPSTTVANYHLIRSWENMRVHTFLKGICPKLNETAPLDFEPAYLESSTFTNTPQGLFQYCLVIHIGHVISGSVLSSNISFRRVTLGDLGLF